MNYPKEMHTFLLQNTALIEKGSLTDDVEATIFAGIHERITQKLERRLWELRCDVLNVNGGGHDKKSYGDTVLCPVHWPKRKDGKRQAYYYIGEHGGFNERWLSSLLGLNQIQPCFTLYVDGRLGGPKINVRERVQAFYAETPALQELGVICTDEKELRLPFSLDAVKLTEAYPDLRKSMLVFEKSFDKLLKANELIDALIMGMVPAGARPTQVDDAAKEPAAVKK
jgi:hypothetical protein